MTAGIDLQFDRIVDPRQLSIFDRPWPRRRDEWKPGEPFDTYIEDFGPLLAEQDLDNQEAARIRKDPQR